VGDHPIDKSLVVDEVDESNGSPRISSRMTSVSGLPVLSQNCSSCSASDDARFIVSRLAVHFLFIVNHSLDIDLYDSNKEVKSTLICQKNGFCIMT
jgi:hypothetical protein